MNPSFPAANRNPALAGLDEAPALPVTPTLRLLEISCGLSRQQVEALLRSPSPARRLSFSTEASAHPAYHAFGVITCGLLLSAIVAALIISLG